MTLSHLNKVTKYQIYYIKEAQEGKDASWEKFLRLSYISTIEMLHMTLGFYLDIYFCGPAHLMMGSQRSQ